VRHKANYCASKKLAFLRTAEQPSIQHANSESDDEHRANIKSTGTSTYRVGDDVYFDPGGNLPLEGPYLIASVPSAGKYTLCYDDDESTAVQDGDEIDESQLSRA